MVGISLARGCAVKNIRVDEKARQRCWNCGGLNFTEKRTMRSKAMVGVGALLTKKKLKCQSCGEYNDTGNAQPYKGPASKKAAKKSGASDLDRSDAETASGSSSAAEVVGLLMQLEQLHDSGALTNEQYETQKAKLLG